MIAFSNAIANPRAVTVGYIYVSHTRRRQTPRSGIPCARVCVSQNNSSATNEKHFLLHTTCRDKNLLIKSGDTHITRIAVFTAWWSKYVTCGAISIPQGSSQEWWRVGIMVGAVMLLRTMLVVITCWYRCLERRG